MIENDAGGDALHIGVSTMCSYRPPPKAVAMEKQRRINDHSARCVSIDAPFGVVPPQWLVVSDSAFLAPS
jgi:hypothetical protein